MSMSNEKESSAISVIPYPFEADELNKDFSFEVESAGTVYTVSTHFDPEGKQSLFEQLQKLLLKDRPHI